MLYTRPDYYKEFTCTADKCDDTCCAGWQIVIDSASMRRYRKEKGSYRKKLHSSIHWLQKTFKQDKERRCTFLTEENLCAMYQNLGEQSLCRTCRQYPRHVEEFENVREISLSISCPEVAKLILSRNEKVTFQSRETEEEEEFENFSPFLYSQLLDTRAVMIDLLQNRNLPILNRVIQCLGLAYDIENRVKADNLFACGEVIENYRKQVHFADAGKRAERIQKNIKKQYHFAKTMIHNLHHLELLKEEWNTMIGETEELLFGYEELYYQSVMEEFEAWIQSEYEGNWDVQCEQLLVYFIYTYFCGAVYDERIFTNVEMAVAAVAVIWHMMASSWLKNEKNLDMEDVVNIVYHYSRELEHSDKNLKTYWDILEKQTKLFLA